MEGCLCLRRRGVPHPTLFTSRFEDALETVQSPGGLTPLCETDDAPIAPR